jgi:membrane fusion protein, multidrug efflux system
VNVIGAVRPHSVVIPQRAVQQGAKSHFVWVVGKDGKAEQRPVIVGTWDGDNWFILDGLKDGDAIVVDGAIRVSAGAALKTTPYAPKPESIAAARKAAEPMSIEQTQMSAPTNNSPKHPPSEKSRDAAKVYFEKDSDVLTPQGAQALGPLARMLAGDPMLAVDIAGYTDKSGASTRNAQLAKDRAKAVRAALIAQGARPEQTSLKVPAAINGGPDNAEARRVDVIPTRVAQAGKKAQSGSEAAAPR